MPKDPIFLVDVAPIVPLPYGKSEVFSYLSKESVPIGSLVLVPFGPRLIRGVALAENKLQKETFSGIRLKHIRSILEPGFLTEEQLALARIISDECLTPLGRTLRHFLPERTKERSAPQTAKAAPASPFRLSKTETATIGKILGSPLPYSFTGTPQDSLRVIAGIIKKSPRGAQILVLVPEHISIPYVRGFLAGIFGNDAIAVFSSTLSGGAQFSAWERIRTGEARIVVGTRQALFAPWKKLSLLVVLDESEILGYKQWDMSPRYDARRVAEILTRLHAARLLFAGMSESGEMRVRIDAKTVLATSENAPLKSPRTEMVNMREERFKKNYSLLSSALSENLEKTLSKNRQVVLIASRSGLDSFLSCESCKTVPRCPQCDRALRSSKEGFFKCPSCSFRTKEFPKCVACGGLSFKSVGGGTERIEREARKKYPRIGIVRIDDPVFRRSHGEEALSEKIRVADVVIGTPSLLHAGELPKASLVAIMDAENFLSFPDFRTDERFVGIVDSSRRILSERIDANVIIQTFHPERELFRAIGTGTEHTLLRRSFEDRKILRYPPFFSLFRIGFHDKDLKRVEETSEEAFRQLSQSAKTLGNVRVSPPRKPLSPKTRGKHERFIVISIPPEDPFPAPLKDVLAALPKNWSFDPNPLSLI